MKAWMVVLIVLGVLGVLVVGAGWYVASNKDEWFARGQALEQEGLKAGAGSSESQCLAAAMARYRADAGVVGAIGARVWLSGCLESSRTEAAFCKGVPVETEILDSAAWRVGICEQHGMGSDSTCANVLAEVQKYCGSPVRARKRSST